MNAKAVREIVVLTDEPDNTYGVVVGREVYLDGVPLLLPMGTKVSASVARTEPLSVTLTICASTVRFESQPPATPPAAAPPPTS